MNTKAAVITTLAVLLPVSCRAQGRESATPLTEFQCGAPLPKTSSAVATLTKDQACVIVGTAMRALAATHAQEGLPDPADTAIVTTARIHELTETSLNGADTIATWWTVTLRLSAKPYDVEVRLNKSDGRALGVAKTHKPFLEPRE